MVRYQYSINFHSITIQITHAIHGFLFLCMPISQYDKFVWLIVSWSQVRESLIWLTLYTIAAIVFHSCATEHYTETSRVKTSRMCVGKLDTVTILPVFLQSRSEAPLQPKKRTCIILVLTTVNNHIQRQNWDSCHHWIYLS